MEQQSINQILESFKNLKSNIMPKTFEMLVEAQKAQAISALICGILLFVCFLFIGVLGYKKITAALVAKHNQIAESTNDLDIVFLNGDISMLNLIRIILVASCFLLIFVSISSMITEINVYLHPEAAVVKQIFGQCK